MNAEEGPNAEKTRDEACPEYAVELFTCSEYLAENAVEIFTCSEYLAEQAVELITWSEYLTGIKDEPTKDAPNEDEAVISTDLKGCVEGYEPENETQDEPNEEAAAISVYLKGYVEACPEYAVELFTRSEYIAQKEEEITEVNAVIPQDEPKDVNTVKLKDELTTSESEEKGVEDFNGVHDPGVRTKAEKKLIASTLGGQKYSQVLRTMIQEMRKKISTAVYMKKCMQRYSNPRKRCQAALRRF